MSAPHDGRARTLIFQLAEFVRCTTPRKLANRAAIEAQRLLRRSRVMGMPYQFFIDPVNACNLRCPLCPTGRGILARPRGLMPLADLRRIVDEIAPFAYRIELYNWGEPLLHPAIFDMIEYASRRRIGVGLSSNLNRLDEPAARRLVTSGLSRLVVSIDGASQETYAAYRRQGDLQAARDNLALLLSVRRALNSRTPFITWRMLVGKHNEREVEAVRAMARQAGVDRFTTGLLYVDTRDPQQVADWVPQNPAYSPYGRLGGRPPENTWHCRDLWRTMVINWDGGVGACCWLQDPEHDFGSLRGRSVRDVWNSPAYQSARRIIGSGVRGPDDPLTICHRCLGHPHYMDY